MLALLIPLDSEWNADEGSRCSFWQGKGDVVGTMFVVVIAVAYCVVESGGDMVLGIVGGSDKEDVWSRRSTESKRQTSKKVIRRCI